MKRKGFPELEIEEVSETAEPEKIVIPRKPTLSELDIQTIGSASGILTSVNPHRLSFTDMLFQKHRCQDCGKSFTRGEVVLRVEDWLTEDFFVCADRPECKKRRAEKIAKEKLRQVEKWKCVKT